MERRLSPKGTPQDGIWNGIFIKNRLGIRIFTKKWCGIRIQEIFWGRIGISRFFSGIFCQEFGELLGIIRYFFNYHAGTMYIPRLQINGLCRITLIDFSDLIQMVVLIILLFLFIF